VCLAILGKSLKIIKGVLYLGASVALLNFINTSDPIQRWIFVEINVVSTTLLRG
jgi:hypothetical protein